MTKKEFLHELTDITTVQKIIRDKTDTRSNNLRISILKRTFNLLNALHKYLPEKGEL